MRVNDSHLSDEQLLALADREASPREAQKYRQHLAKCEACRRRGEQWSATTGSLDQFRRNLYDGQVPSPAAARSRLKNALTAEAGPVWVSAMGTWRWRIGHAAAAIVFATGAWLVAAHGFNWRSERTAIPRARLTPGDTVLLTASEVCVAPSANGSTAAVPVSLQQAVFREYGIPNARPQDYEVDYLITPELGGSASLRNLWPEPYSAKWNARVKDQLEDRLHAMVCQGQLDLATAQREIASNWVSAYRKYFHTREPLELR